MVVNSKFYTFNEPQIYAVALCLITHTMNKILVLFPLLFLALSSTAQTSDNIVNKTSEYKKLDFSSVFVGEKFYSDNRTEKYNRVEPIGYFGSNYQRVFVHFISVIQDQENPLVYFVYGKTKLKDNISVFQGKIIIKEVIEYKRHEFPEFNRGEINGEYVFFEDTKNNGSGKFQGEFTSSWLINQDNKVEYDGMMLAADGFSNNQFEGVWISYNSGKEYICNWGDYRIPNSGNLDNGAGEFFPSKEYLNRGWQTYIDQYGDPSEVKTKRARELEKANWW